MQLGAPAAATGDPDGGGSLWLVPPLVDGVGPPRGFRAGGRAQARGVAVFEAWLLVERRRLGSVAQGVLGDAALDALAVGDPLDGVALAARALALDEFDEGAHGLVVRCLARAGETGAARHHAIACEVLFRRELGREPDERVRRAAADSGVSGSRAHDRAPRSRPP